MKEMSGLDATKEILSFDNTAKILLLTTFLDDEYIVTALKYGAKGYILKQDYTAIVPALEAVYSGQSVFGTEIISKLPELLNKKHEFDYSDYDINERELEVIKEIADGHSNKEIAADLYLSEGTVRNYLSSILDKLKRIFAIRSAACLTMLNTFPLNQRTNQAKQGQKKYPPHYLYPFYLYH